jgi:hypothetical protein
MPLVTIARPAPPAPPVEESAGLAPLFVVLRFLFWTATLKPLLMCLAVTGMCTYWLGNQTVRGRFRHHLRPFWVACAAWYVTPWTPWAWLGLAVALYLAPNRGRWLSAREQASIADAACLLAAWQVVTPGLELTVRSVLFLEFTAAGLAPWWLSRAWRSEPPALPDEWEERWEYEVAQSPKAGPLADTILTRDEAAGRYRLRCAPGNGGPGIAKADALACSLLSRPPGTVTISHDPEGDINDYLVAFTDRTDGTVVRYADGPTLDDDGTIATADTADGRAIRVAIYTPAGAAHFLILATNRYGKGVIMRNIGLELCVWDKAFVIVVDAKGNNDGGSGLPELRGAADVYAWRKADWKAAIHLEHELFEARSSRYSGKAAFWHPNKPVDGYCDPLVASMKDELRNISKSIGRRELDMLEQLSSMGATYGIGQYGNSQKGDAESTFSTAWRNDIRGNGTVFIGRAGDSQAAGIAAQGFDVDLSRLPNGRGWWLIKTSLTDAPLIPARGRLYPTRDEVDYQGGIEAPHGTVEDWLTMTRRAKLHPQDQEIVERWRPEFEDAPPAEVEPEPVYEAEPTREVVEVAAGVHVEEPRRLAAVPDLQPDTKPALDLIPDVVRKGGVMTRGEIAEAVGIKPEYASDRLKKLKEMGVVTEARTADGRPGWRVVA